MLKCHTAVTIHVCKRQMDSVVSSLYLCDIGLKTGHHKPEERLRHVSSSILIQFKLQQFMLQSFLLRLDLYHRHSFLY
jgi:hypothetical protein